MPYNMNYGLSGAFGTIALGVIIAILGYGAFPLIFALCKPRIKAKYYRWICYLVNFFVFLCFTIVDGNPNTMPYMLWSVTFAWLFQKLLPKTEPAVDYSKLEKKSFDEIASSVPEEVLAQCGAHRGSRDGITSAAEAFVKDGVIPPEYVPALVDEFMKPVDHKQPPEKIESVVSNDVQPILNENLKPEGQIETIGEKKVERTENTKSSNAAYIAAISVLSVAVIALTIALVSAPTKADVVESYDNGLKAGYTAAMEDVKEEIPKDILADHYLNLIAETGFDIMLNLEEDGVIPTLDRYFIDNVGRKADVRDSYFLLADTCENLMVKFAEIIVD